MLDENTEKIEYTIDNHFIPCVNWFKTSIKQTNIKINASERWKKMSFGNRCTLLGGNGLINLSVPVKNGRDQQALFRDIQISYLDNWQVKFWRTISSCYGRAPFFVYYADEIQEILFKKHDYLSDLNIEFIKLMLRYLRVNKEVMIVDDNKISQLDMAAHYLTPRNFQAEPSPQVYHQLFSDRFGFQANLSILDLLFMEGPEAKYILDK